MKKIFVYFGISAFIFIFSQIYEYFSHGVYSNFMVFAFLIPFIGLFIPSLINIFIKREISDSAKLSWKCGIATLTVGSLYKGVLDIYGTSGNFEMIYLTVGIVLCIIAGAMTALGKIEKSVDILKDEGKIASELK